MFTNRFIEINRVHEVVCRVRNAIAFPPTRTSNALLVGIFARSIGLRNGQVELIAFVWMGTHWHIMTRPKKVKELVLFYKECKKRSTEAAKDLLGLEHLRMWEPRPNVMYIPLKVDVIDRLAYLFCNPAKAGLVDSIDEYPGFNTWEIFKTCEPSVDACVRIPARYYQRGSIPRLPENRKLTDEQDRDYLMQLISAEHNVMEEYLEIRPFEWLKAYGIKTPEQVEAVRAAVIKEVYKREAQYRAERAAEGRTVIGAEALQRGEYMQPYKNKKHGRRIPVYCSDSKLRAKILNQIERLQKRCRNLYETAKKGKRVVWPPGVFIPWTPPIGTVRFATRETLRE
jgi:hypothetical protein